MLPKHLKMAKSLILKSREGQVPIVTSPPVDTHDSNRPNIVDKILLPPELVFE